MSQSLSYGDGEMYMFKVYIYIYIANPITSAYINASGADDGGKG